MKCPRGTEAIAGGYRLTNHIDISGPTSSALLPYSSRRAGKMRWQVSAYKFGPSSKPERLTALAYCQRRADSLSVAVARSTLTVNSFDDSSSVGAALAFATATAPCPAGTRALSGGFRISVNGSATSADGPPVAMVFGSRAAGNGWELTAARLRRGTMRFKAVAYCGADRVLRRSRTVRFKGDGRPTPSSVPPVRGTRRSCPVAFAPGWSR